MNMKRYAISAVIIAFITLFACGGGGGGGGGNGGGGGGGGGGSESVPTDPKAILYAAYAGIGYMQADNASDNELLYNAMFYDLNQVTGLLMAKAVTFDSQSMAKILSILALNKASVTFTNTQDPDTSVSVILKVNSEHTSSTITIYAVGEDGQPLYNDDGTPVTIDKTVQKYNLICNMTVDIKGSNGYTPHDSQGNPIGSATYYGDQSVDLTAYADVDVLWGDALDVIGNKLTITTSKSLRASYSSTPPFDIKYQQWNISYGFNQGDTLTNMHLLPINYLIEALGFGDLSKLADYQLYSLNGKFTLNNKEAYTFDAMKYGQLEIKQQIPLDGKYIALSGKINDVEVSSFGSEFLEILLGNGDLITLVGKIGHGDVSLTDVIAREDDPQSQIPEGVWKSGKLTLKSVKNSVAVSFNSDGSADCSGSEQWNEPDWQNSLDPIK